MVNKHQFQLLAKAFRAGKISLSDFTEQAFNPPAGTEAKAADAKPSAETTSSEDTTATDDSAAK